MEMTLVIMKHHDTKQNFDIHQIFKLARKIKQFIKVIAGGKYTNSETQKNKALTVQIQLIKVWKIHCSKLFNPHIIEGRV